MVVAASGGVGGGGYPYLPRKDGVQQGRHEMSRPWMLIVGSYCVLCCGGMDPSKTAATSIPLLSSRGSRSGPGLGCFSGGVSARAPVPVVATHSK